MPNQHVEVGPFALSVKSVLLPMGLKVASVEVEGLGASVDSKPFAVEMVQPGTMEAHVLEADLSAFLEAQAPGGLHEFSVRAEGGKLHVSAKKTVLIDIKIEAVASLRIVEARKLYIDVETVDVMKGYSVKNLVQTEIAKINPVLDAEDLPIDANLTSVEVGNGRVVLRGTVSPR